MAKKNKKVARLTSDARPTATNVDWPVFVPNSDGSTDIEVGRARLRYGTLVVEFKNSVPAVAIQNMIERGVLLGFGMIMLKPDVVNEMYQDVVAGEEAEAARIEAGLKDGSIWLNPETNEFEPTAVDRVVEYDEVEPNTFHIQTNPDPVIDEVIKNYNNEENN